MTADYKQLYETYVDLLDVFLKDNEFFESFLKLLKDSPSEIAFLKKQCVKSLEAEWLDTIEKHLPALDYCIRNPRNFIENKEEILPIEISRNITAESIKHLAQHTNLISNYDGENVTPSKILNVYKEESFDTYENRFINTLLNRLYIFIEKRYEKIKDAMLADDYLVLKLEQEINVNESESANISFELKSAYKTTTDNELGKQEFERLKKLRSVILNYNSSTFADIMKNIPFIRPPVSRTNAILNNPELKECLNLWLFIESYDKIGYSIDFIDTASKPPDTYIEELFGITALNYALFKLYTEPKGDSILLRHVRRKKALVPKFLKDVYDEITDEFNISEVEFRKIMDEQRLNLRRKKNADAKKVKAAVDTALSAERQYKRELIKKQKRSQQQKRKNKKTRKDSVIN